MKATKNEFWKHSIRQLLLGCLLLVGSFWLVSCDDDYVYDEMEPEWLGESIYDYLVEQGNYTSYVRLIDDIGYASVLAKTGSKTLFVTDDAAFERFYQNNPWGVSGYEDLSLSQKKLILNFGMIDNAYLIETLANYYWGGLQEGTAIRRNTAVSPFDSVAYETGSQLPAGPWWDGYRETGIHLLKDQTSTPLMYFLERPLMNAGISNEDFRLITGKERQSGDAHIYGIKVVERDITCKNGYVHVLEDVMIPPSNIAEHIRNNSSTQIFSGLLERFSAPYFSSEIDQEYKLVKPDFTNNLFVKQYYSEVGGANIYPDNTLINDELLLPFNPGWNSYRNNALQSDMATILSPNDAAMTEYLNSSSGLVLKNRYGNWETIPDNIVMKFLERHMRGSFLQSVPSRFDKMSDSQNNLIPITTSDVVDAFLGVNGLVYETNTVYPPNDYVSVYAPVLFGQNTKIFNWVINKLDYTFYLNSLVSQYSFFVPTDEFFENYVDPFAISKNVKGALKFWYNEATSSVSATAYAYNEVTGEVGDSLAVIHYGGSSTSEYGDYVLNRLWDLLDSHVVVGDVESGSRYHLTKGGTLLRTEGNGLGLKIQGGGDIERNKMVNVTEIYEQDNGTTYFVDKPIQAPLKSVYTVLSQTPEFSEFFDLLTGFPPASESVVFVKKTNYFGIDFNIKFFNTYNYTVFVPTNEAINAAIANGVIIPWESRDGILGINEMETLAEQNSAIKNLERFLRYHFQDNAVLISGESVVHNYQTATIKLDDLPSHFGTYKDKYYKLGINGDGENLTITTESNSQAQVVKDKGLYNIITRDYVFNGNPLVYREVDGSGTGSLYSGSRITTSSSAVIHQVDNVLMFKD
ncbi:MAG: fasciclin domain-containing protein [Bacteroidales bacterium]|nr:fasciclin domain-containing protein [Bacteroidales bacterium]